MNDTDRLDAMLASRAWRQPLIKFKNRDEIDAAIARGNPDGPPIPSDYACRNSICHITGMHTASCLRSHGLQPVIDPNKPVFICPHPINEHGRCMSCGESF